MVTFVDATKTRRKRDPGRCYVRAGWTRLEERTKEDGLIVLQLLPDEMPVPSPPIGAQLGLLDLEAQHAASDPPASSLPR